MKNNYYQTAIAWAVIFCVSPARLGCRREAEILDGGNPPRVSIIGNVCIRGPDSGRELVHSVRLSCLPTGAQIYVSDNPCEADATGGSGSGIVQVSLEIYRGTVIQMFSKLYGNRCGGVAFQPVPGHRRS
ncbi:MAG: hypothetical protein JXB45_01740 [Candidatus Krumholzibacteriota bacterium]|nr:hypothetical protein [Candidatus Krumholzibacteriota bacterium]